MSAAYYAAYEERYRKVYEAGGEFWGSLPEDASLRAELGAWVNANRLQGKRVMEFACGEGGSGVILCEAGCRYQGGDLAPSAVEKATKRVEAWKDARVRVMDMVREPLEENSLDAALDVAGLHMLITDSHRADYLENVFHALKPGAPALFCRESYREDSYEGPVETLEAWAKRMDLDLTTPQKRPIGPEGKMVEIPLLAARTKNMEGYRQEMEKAGFVVDAIIPVGGTPQIVYSVSVYVHKPEGEAK